MTTDETVRALKTERSRLVDYQKEIKKQPRTPGGELEVFYHTNQSRIACLYAVIKFLESDGKTPLTSS